MSGLTEILLLVAIILVIFILPRMLNRKSDDLPRGPAKPFRMTGRIRLIVLASLIWPGLIALFLKPWQGSWLTFIYIGIAPVALTWGICWVFMGFKNHRN